MASVSGLKPNYKSAKISRYINKNRSQQAGIFNIGNNFLAVSAPAVPVPGVPAGPGDKVKQEAGKNIASKLQGAINDVADWFDKATDCLFERACSSNGDEQQNQPSIGKELTDIEKAELGGLSSGKPGRHGPDDEECVRITRSSSYPKNRAQHGEYVDPLRASMEKPNVRDVNLKNIIDDLYRPNTKVGSGSTADAAHYELSTGEKVGGRGYIEKAQTYSIALQDWLNKNP